MRRIRNVKIVATLGPASAGPEMVEALFVAGVDVFRVNMSHSSHEALARYHEIIRGIEARRGRPIGILADLQGPKLRIGSFKEEKVELKAGDSFVLDNDSRPGDESRVELPHPEIFAAAMPGEHLLLNDGRVRVEIIEVQPERLITRVIFGGTLSARKGVNVPDAVLPLAPLTEKDHADLEFAAALGVDWIAQSFVQRAQDVIEARRLIAGRAGIMVKVEKPAALKEIDEIIEASDSIMVARGDLGVELPLEEVPGWQKRLTRGARLSGKPVVVATQMLELMIVEPVPTRAEVSDVATAVFEGADAVMLSAEFGDRRLAGQGGRDDGPHRPCGGERSALSRARAGRAAPSRSRPRPTPSPMPPARLPRRSAPRPSSATPDRARRASGWRASGRRCRSSR